RQRELCQWDGCEQAQLVNSMINDADNVNGVGNGQYWVTVTPPSLYTH
ncbi:6220_t:CDS:1, partial [Ambispora leptoticha]